MPRGQTLANVLLLVKSELGYSLTANVAVADDQQLYHLIDNEQNRLASEYDWPFLERRSDVVVIAGQRNANIPANIVFERPIVVEKLSSTLWCPLIYGI